MADDARRRLERLGRQDPPPPRAEFTERLADDLRHLSGDAMPERGHRWVRTVPLLLAAAVVLIVVGAVVLASASDPALELETARSVRVLEPDGDAVDGVRGLELDDGDRVLVGEGGRAKAGDVVLGPGDEAIVVDGRLEPVRTTTTTNTTRTTAAPTTLHPPTVRRPEAPSPTTTAREAPDRTTTTVGVDRTTTTTTARDEPVRTTTTTRGRSTDAARQSN